MTIPIDDHSSEVQLLGYSHYIPDGEIDIHMTINVENKILHY